MPQASPHETSPDTLIVRYIPLSTVLRWERNPKLHDIGGLVQSIRKHGLKQPMRYEPTLNDGTGGIAAGNGREEALESMKRDDFSSPPRGVLVDGEDWLVPVLFGVDAPSQKAAIAYAVDDNNLVMSGGDFTIYDFARMWDLNGYAAVLHDLADMGELPLTVDIEDVLSLDKLMEANVSDAEPPGLTITCPHCGMEFVPGLRAIIP